LSIIVKIARNTAWLFISQLLASLLSIVLGILIARELGVIGFGEYSLALALGAVFVIFADIGYQILLLREVSRDTTHVSKYLNNVTGVRVLFTIIVFVAMVAIVSFIGYPAYIQQLIWLFGLYTLLTSLNGVYQVTFRAYQQMKYEALITMQDCLVRLGLGATVLLLNYGLIALGVVFVISSAFTLVLSIVVCSRKFVRPGISLDLKFIKETIWIALPLSIIPILSIIFLRIDTVLLSILKGTEVVGWYSASYTIVLSLRMVPTIFMAAVFPAAQKTVGSRDLYFSYYEKAIRYLLALGIPMAVGLTFLAGPIITLIYGPAFAPSIPALQILAWDTLLFFVYLAIGNALLGIGQERKVAFSALICAVVNVVLNILLIPPYGLIGSSVVTVVSEIVLLVLYLHFFKMSLRPLAIRHYALKPTIASIPIVAICLLFGSNFFIALVLSTIAYFATFLAIHGLDENEHNIFMNYVRTIVCRVTRAGRRGPGA
jgi:O-antigen/teichoic acid export membrane protein